MNHPTAYLVALSIGFAVTQGTIAAIGAVDSYFSHQNCIAEQTAALFSKQETIAICADRLK